MAKSKAKSKLTVSVVPPTTSTSASKKKRAKKKAASITQLPPYVELMVDPFTAPRAGAEPPDETTNASIVWEDVYTSTLTTNAQGEFLLEVNPHFAAILTNYTLDATAGGGVSTASSIVTTANYTNLAGTFSSYRPMCASLTVEYCGQADAAKGIIGVATGNIGLATVGSTLLALADERSYKEMSVTHEESIAACVKYSHGDYIDVASTSAVSGQQLSYIYCGGTGLPASTACIRLRVRLVGDFVAKVTSLLQTQSVYVPHHPAQIAVANSIIGPDSETATGKSAAEKLAKHRRKAAWLASELNGLKKEARNWMPVLAEFAALMS